MKCSDTGPPDAKILLVGEAPGKTEDIKGLPFVGASGKLLKQMLAHSGINYNQCYVTNVVDSRPPGNNFNYLYEQKSRKTPSRALLAAWDILREKVERIKPNIVICLGAEPMRALTGKRGIKEWRGTLLPYKGIKVLPCYHPSYIMRVYNHHVIAEMDFSKALKESEFVELKVPDANITIKPSLPDVIGWIDAAYRYNSKKRISWDLETVGKHIRCLGLAAEIYGVKSAISIPFIKFPSSSMAVVKNNVIKISPSSDNRTSYWSATDEVIILEAIAKLFANKDIEIVGQNSISFDQPLLEQEFGIEISNHYMDTMHLWHVIHPELPMGLSFLCSVLTNYQNYWTEKDTTDDESEWLYNAMDSIVTLDVSYVIEEDAKRSGLSDIYFNHVHKLAIALSRSQQVGVLIDTDRRDELIKEHNIKTEEVLARIKILAGHEVNPASPKQMKKLLYDELKFPTMYKKGGDKSVTTDEEALRKLAKAYPNEEILTKIIEFRKASKLVSTFLDLPLDPDKRMRTSYNASGTKNPRISSSKTLWNTGMNLQNIPTGKTRGVTGIRDIFIAKPGCVFVKGDLSQAETRAVAHILRRLGDPTLYNLYQDPDFDMHKWMASFIYEKDEKDIIKSERDVGKLANHSGNYCAGPGVLQTKAIKDGIPGVDYKFAKKILEIRHEAIPGLKLWWAWVEKQLRQTRILRTCLGRRRIFFGRLDDQTTIRDAVAYEPQGIVGDVCNEIFWKMDDFCRKQDFYTKPVLQVHDEVVIECEEKVWNGIAMVMQDTARQIELWICDDLPLIIPIDISIGPNWKDCKAI